MLIMLYIHTKKSLKKYICFLFCFIFIFGVNFGFVNLPSVSAEGQNEVVKWGADVGDPLEISNVTSTSVEGKVSPSVSMKSVNAYVYPYPSATEEDLIKAINDTTIAAANVVNSVASSLDAIGADWNVKANTARNNARSATTLAAATAAAKDAKDAADAANTAAWRANSGAAAKDAYAAKDAADAARNAANSGAAKDAANAAATAADYAEDAARFEGRGGANDADCDFLNGADFSNAASAAYNAYKVYDIYNSINDNNTTNKAAVDAAFNVVKTAYNYHGFSLPPSALAASNKSLGDISSGEQTFEVNNLEPNKKYILAIDFEDDSGNPGYITRPFTTTILVNLQINGLIGYYTGQPQELVDQFKFFDNGVEITDEGILGILKLNVYLRAQKRGGNSTNWYNLNNLSNLTGISSGIYDFYYYVDSEAEGMSAYIVSA